jgi:hypothetical protein
MNHTARLFRTYARIIYNASDFGFLSSDGKDYMLCYKVDEKSSFIRELLPSVLRKVIRGVRLYILPPDSIDTDYKYLWCNLTGQHMSKDYDYNYTADPNITITHSENNITIFCRTDIYDQIIAHKMFKQDLVDQT